MKIAEKLIILICCVNLFNCNESDEYKTVRINSGFVRGKKYVTLFENKPYYAFKGIPYARPPLDEFRFKAPKPAISWTDVKDAFEFGNECVQTQEIVAFGTIDEYVVGNEDCLYINVYTPDVTANLPVMFFIHGGAFIEGSANLYGPDFILNQDNVILVTINYRLGVFGFLTLNTAEYSENMGLKDQLYALKWVHRNIDKFGGNKELVTIFGESAGGASTHYHTIVKHNSNLFQRAIIMSGTVKNSWAALPHNDQTYFMFDMARRIGNPVSNKDDLIKFLNKIDGKILVEQGALPKYNAGLARKTVSFFNYGPVIENSIAHDPYLTEDINEMISKDSYTNKIDTMFGYTSMEALFIVGEEINDDCLLRSFNKVFEFQLPLDDDVDIQYNSKEYKEIARKTREFYFGENGQVNKESIAQYVDLMSAIWFTYPVDVAVKQQAIKSSGNTFYYVFSVDDENNISKRVFNLTLSGAGHFDEICYLFRCSIPNFYDNFVEDSVARKTVERITKLWVNFAKFGDPSVPSEKLEIKPIIRGNINYFNISNGGIGIGKNPKKSMAEFWDNIYVNYRNQYNKPSIKVKTEL